MESGSLGILENVCDPVYYIAVCKIEAQIRPRNTAGKEDWERSIYDKYVDSRNRSASYRCSE